MTTEGRKGSKGENGKEKGRILITIRMMRTMRDVNRIV
jgi:hypothetical protein